MKHQEEIRHRLEKLYERHQKNYVSKYIRKSPQNCKHNLLHTSSDLIYKSEVELSISPRSTNSLVVIQDNVPIRICTYNSNDPGLWNGDICDDDETAEQCSYFEPLANIENLKARFQMVLLDDKETQREYPDIASLQWVLDIRHDNVEKISITARLNSLLKLTFIKISATIGSWFRKNHTF